MQRGRRLLVTVDRELDVDAGAAFRSLNEVPQQLPDGHVLERLPAQLEQQGAHLRESAAVQASYVLGDLRGPVGREPSASVSASAFRVAANSAWVTESCRSRASRVLSSWAARFI